jgi:hypothetical protein
MGKTPKGFFSVLGDDDVQSEGGSVDANTVQYSGNRRRLYRLGLIVTVLLVSFVAIALALNSGSETSPPPSVAKDPVNEPSKFVQLGDMVTLEGIRSHLESLDRLAKAHENTRVMGSPGYNASMKYVIEMLESKASGLEVVPQAQAVSLTPDMYAPQFGLLT